MLATKSITSLNLIALCFLLFPSTLYRLGMGAYQAEIDATMILSRGTSIILIVLYIIYLFFTLRTHSNAFDEDLESDEEDTISHAVNDSLGPIAAIAWLAVSLIGVVTCMKALLSSIERSDLKAYPTLIGLILFPFLGNVTDYVSACVVAYKDQLDITILVTIGSSMQIMLFTWPSLVVLGWIIGQPMNPTLDLFEAAVVFLGVFISSSMVRSGKSNYLIGAMCIAL
jgi:Ca2+:H+ antiporter